MCEDGWREAMVGTLAFYDAMILHERDRAR